jgi:CRISPR-associated protein Csb2
VSLVLEIEFLSGVYYGSRAPESDRSDWPPQFDRVFSALVASWGMRGERAEEEAALEWLEALPCPRLFASPAEERFAYTSFVPPNDASSSRKKHRAEVLPPLRQRQPRRFVAARPLDPVLRIVWPESEPTREALSALQALAADVAYVGHSASLTRCRFLTSEAPSVGDPQHRVRSVYPGRLTELRRLYRAGRRPAIGKWEPLTPPATPVVRSVFDERWLVLEALDIPSLPDVRAAALVCAAIRDAIVTRYEAITGRKAPEVVSGRGPDGVPAVHPHMAVVPLAFVGFPHADGHLMGFGVIPPRSTPLLGDPTFTRVLRSLAPYDERLGRRVLSITVQSPSGGGREIRLSPTLDPGPRSLDPALYVRREGRLARTFATVTPIVLDRHGKEPPPEREAEIVAEIAQACEHIGLPRPSGDGLGVVLTKHSAVMGAPSARPSPKSPPWMRWVLPRYLQSRPLTHAVIRFDEAVEGPIILGAGRFVGLGLAMPIEGR